MVPDNVKVGIAAAGLLLAGFATSIASPLLYDSLNPTHSPWIPTSGNGSAPVTLTPSRPAWMTIDPLFCITVSMLLDVAVTGLALLYVMARHPGMITERERSYPKRHFILAGCLQAIAAVLTQYSASGERIAPYLQVMLVCGNIPVTFILRFVVLRKRPTIKKALCAAAIFVAISVSLIPTFISGLESDAKRRAEGGATGVWRVIWPLIRFSAFIPGALKSIYLERIVKEVIISREATPTKTEIRTTDEQALLVNAAETEDNTDDRLLEGVQNKTEVSGVEDNPGEELNMLYTMFWVFLFTVIATISLVWADFIPKFGLVAQPSLFGKQIWFNTKCIVGFADDCGTYVISLFWGRMAARTSAFIFAAFLLRFSDGANFSAICQATVSPIKLLFWTLFEESPFRWNPHPSLSTWLSGGALAVIIPSLTIYTRR